MGDRTAKPAISFEFDENEGMSDVAPSPSGEQILGQPGNGASEQRPEQLDQDDLPPPPPLPAQEPVQAPPGPAEKPLQAPKGDPPHSMAAPPAAATGGRRAATRPARRSEPRAAPSPVRRTPKVPVAWPRAGVARRYASCYRPSPPPAPARLGAVKPAMTHEQVLRAQAEHRADGLTAAMLASAEASHREGEARRLAVDAEEATSGTEGGGPCPRPTRQQLRPATSAAPTATGGSRQRSVARATRRAALRAPSAAVGDPPPYSGAARRNLTVRVPPQPLFSKGVSCTPSRGPRASHPSCPRKRPPPWEMEAHARPARQPAHQSADQRMLDQQRAQLREQQRAFAEGAERWHQEHHRHAQRVYLREVQLEQRERGGQQEQEWQEDQQEHGLQEEQRNQEASPAPSGSHSSGAYSTLTVDGQDEPVWGQPHRLYDPPAHMQGERGLYGLTVPKQVPLPACPQLPAGTFMVTLLNMKPTYTLQAAYADFTTLLQLTATAHNTRWGRADAVPRLLTPFALESAVGDSMDTWFAGVTADYRQTLGPMGGAGSPAWACLHSTEQGGQRVLDIRAVFASQRYARVYAYHCARHPFEGWGYGCVAECAGSLSVAFAQ
jgi:hypothetical protein